MPATEPLTTSQKDLLCAHSSDCVNAAAEMFSISLQPIPVYFDIKGRSAGQYRVKKGERSIHVNPFIAARYFDDAISSTIPHEVAHYVADCLFGMRNIRPHGKEWRRIMCALGAEPRATCNHDLSGLPVRRQKRFPYACNCDSFELTTVRHNRVIRGQATYHCKKCHAVVRYVGRDDGQGDRFG